MVSLLLARFYTILHWQPEIPCTEKTFSATARLLLSFSELTLTYALQQDSLQESDAQERRWLLALELHSYFIRKLLKNLFLPPVDQTFIEKLFYGSVCYRGT